MICIYDTNDTNGKERDRERERERERERIRAEEFVKF